jgi:hypothetical protein
MFSFLKKAWTHFLFPRLCLQCEAPLSPLFTLLCEACFENLLPFDNEECCKRCLSSLEKGNCGSCVLFPSPFDHVFPVFIPSSACSTLITSSRKWESFSSAQGIGALMGTAYLKNGGAFPDLLISLPPFDNKIGEELALIMQRPFLKRGVLRAFLEPHRIKHATGLSLENRSVALLGESFTPEFLEAGKALSALFPKRLEGIVFTANTP